MSRPTRIEKYDPKKSVHENALMNGVSDAAMYLYLRNHNKGRNIENAKSVVKEIKKALKDNPDASQAKVAELTKHSVTTINKYWKVATEGEVLRTARLAKEETGPKPFVWKEDIPEPEKQGHVLMSKRLATLQNLFEYADTLDVGGLHDFLFEQPEKPMLFIGNGGMHDHFASLMYEMNCGVAKSITPLEFASMSDATIKNSRCMLLSVGGGNDDIKYAAKRALELNPENTACYTNYIHDRSVFTKFEGTPARVFNFRVKRFDDGFISVEHKFFRDAIMLKAFTGLNLSSFDVCTTANACYRYSLNKTEGRITPLKKINHFIVLFSDFGAPAAHDFESVLAETGVASAQVTDFRNYCHGRFLMMANHTKHSSKKHVLSDSDAAAVLLVTPRNRDLVQSIREIALPTSAPIVIIETEYNDARAALDLLIKSNVFLADYEEKGLGNNPCDPVNYNAAEVNKLYPKNDVKFIQEVKRNGEMTLGIAYSNEATESPIVSQGPSPKALELKAKIDALVEVEHKNTETLKNNPSFLPIPTKKDLRNAEHYDVSKHFCVAFRRGKDYWKDLPIPLGNMNGGYAYEMNGIEFPTSEQAYIFGVFSHNTEKHKSIQREVLASKSGYDAKRVVRRAHKIDQRWDWGSFNLDWMMYCVWQKVQNNKDFKDVLMAIPEGATIIEDTSFKEPDKFWGCVNTEKKEFGKLAKKYAKSLNLKTKAETERRESELLWDYCNIGVYEGKNVMGKILTIIKDCLHKGTEPDIDYELLNKKEIYLLGKKVLFD